MGNTLVVPIVSEILKIEKQWVVTEEIHITQREECETVQHNVAVSEEKADIRRVDAVGNVVPAETVASPAVPDVLPSRKPASLLARKEPENSPLETEDPSGVRSILKGRGKKKSEPIRFCPNLFGGGLQTPR